MKLISPILLSGMVKKGKLIVPADRPYSEESRFNSRQEGRYNPYRANDSGKRDFLKDHIKRQQEERGQRLRGSQEREHHNSEKKHPLRQDSGIDVSES
jgi:hypothetical protein